MKKNTILAIVSVISAFILFITHAKASNNGANFMINKNFGFSSKLNVMTLFWEHQRNILHGTFNIRPEVNIKFIF